MRELATLSDVIALTGSLDTEEETRAKALIKTASARLLKKMADAGVTVDEGDELQTAILNSVCATAVARAVPTAIGSAALASESMTAGSYTVQNSYTYANPTGDLYFKKEELRDLGILDDSAFTLGAYFPDGGDEDAI